MEEITTIKQELDELDRLIDPTEDATDWHTQLSQSLLSVARELCHMQLADLGAEG